MNETVKKVLVGVATLATVSLAPVNVEEMKFIAAGQDYCGDSYMDYGTTTVKEKKIFTVNCKEGGKYSYAYYENKKGEVVYTQIPNELYVEMGEPGGYIKNPKESELLSLFETFAVSANAAINRPSRQSALLNDTGLTITVSTTTIGTNILLAVGLYDQSNQAAGNITGCTFDGVNMFEYIEASVVGDGGGNASQALIAATTTAKTANLVCTRTNNANDLFLRFAQYNEVNQSIPVEEAKSVGSVSTTSVSTHATASVDGVWTFGQARNAVGPFNDTTNFVNFEASAVATADSNGTSITAGTVTVTAAYTGGASILSLVSMLIKPSASAAVSTPSTIIIFE